MRAGLVEDVGVGNTVSDRCRHLSVPERTPASERPTLPARRRLQMGEVTSDIGEVTFLGVAFLAFLFSA